MKFTPEHEQIADTVRKFVAKEINPHVAEWEAAQEFPSHEVFKKLGKMGFLGINKPTKYGGLGLDYRYDAVIDEEVCGAGLTGLAFALHSNVVVPYITSYGSKALIEKYIPRMVTGELIGAIAMTEPGTGSDLQAIRTSARRDGDDYVLNGQKTFITNGGNANLIIVACKTGGEGAKGMSLLVLETDGAKGFRRGPLLDKIGMKSQDTAELFFDDVRVPAENLLGGAEGQGFIQLMQQLPQERLIVALGGIGAMERALAETVAYTKERQAFGKPIWAFQNTRFKLAEVQATVLAARAMVDVAMLAHLRGELGVERAALLKYWVTEQQGKVMDECLQLFGGYGYMSEYPIAELYTDARVQRIYGGTNEIMKELASRFM